MSRLMELADAYAKAHMSFSEQKARAALAAEIGRLEAENERLKQTMVDGVTIQQYIDLDNEADVLKAELLEQARIVGMGGERELKLMAENEKLRQALSPFVLANSSEEHMTLIVRTADITAARAALGEK